MEKHTWINLSTHLPHIITSEVKRLFAWLFLPWNTRIAMCKERQTWLYWQRRKNYGRTVPLWMKMTLKSCHFYDSCQRLRTWELKRTITENKRTSKKLSLNKNLPVREIKKKPWPLPLWRVLCYHFTLRTLQLKMSSFTSKSKVPWLLCQAANLESRRPEHGPC